MKVLEAHANDDGSFSMVVEDPFDGTTHRVFRGMITKYTYDTNRVRGGREIVAVYDHVEPCERPAVVFAHDAPCSCEAKGRCLACLRRRFDAFLADVDTIGAAITRTHDAKAIAAMQRVHNAIDSLLFEAASSITLAEALREVIANVEAERDRWAARVKLVEGRIDAAIGILRGTALAAVEVFADAGCTADEIDDAIAFLDPNGNAGDVEPGDVTNHGYRVPIALAKIATALRRRGQ